jgi:hypothetical protein
LWLAFAGRLESNRAVTRLSRRWLCEADDRFAQYEVRK